MKTVLYAPLAVLLPDRLCNTSVSAVICKSAGVVFIELSHISKLIIKISHYHPYFKQAVNNPLYFIAMGKY